MTTNSKTTSAPAEPVDLRRVLWVGVAAVVLSVLVNALVRVLALAVLAPDPGFLPLQSPAFVPFTIIGGGAGVLVFALLAWRTRRPITIFRIIAVIVLILSYWPDLGLLNIMPGANAATVGTLMLMHTFTAAIIVGALTTFTRKK